MHRTSSELSQNLTTVADRLCYVVSVGLRIFGNRLDDFAKARHGWVDSDGGNGVIYPQDLDDFERVALGRGFQDGWVSIYGFWGPEKDGFEDMIQETEYLAALSRSFANAPDI